MGFVANQVFTSHAEALTECIHSSVEDFAISKSMPVLDKQALGQMSVPLESLSKELLMFGLDQWPGEANEIEDCVAVPPAPIIVLPKRRMFAVRGRTMAVAACFSVAGIGALAAHSALDFDGDGSISIQDLHASLDWMVYGNHTITRVTLHNGVKKMVTISYSHAPGVAYEVEKITPIVEELASN